MIDLNALLDEKVFIAIPQGELGRYSDFDASLDNVLLPRHIVKKRLFGIYIAGLQNELARIFLASDCDWFWLLNDDQPYPRTTLVQLLAAKKDIVVPLALEKAIPHWPLIYDDHEPDQPGMFKHRYLRRGETGLIRIYAAGGGGMLVHRRVFETIPEPWWTVTTRIAETKKFEQSSEDFDFAMRVKSAGIEMWCDLDIHVVHIAHYGLRPAVEEGTGEWRTVLIRGDEQIVIPAAGPPPSSIAQPSILVPKRERWVK